MDYYLYNLKNDERIKCGSEVAQLNKLDNIINNGIWYTVEHKRINFDRGYTDICVHSSE